ncbi:MAG: type II toxin-antitoxin system Phd/YefM family antitoxin [Terrimicrobiaceae bacterium]
MEATVVDLRYHMNDVLKALERNESVHVRCRGKVKGIIRPVREASFAKVVSHPFFGIRASERSTDQIVDELRGGRHRDL